MSLSPISLSTPCYADDTDLEVQPHHICSIVCTFPSYVSLHYSGNLFVPGLWYLFNMRMNVSILPDALFPLLLGLGYPCLTLLRRFLQECPSYHSHTEIRSAVVANGLNPPFHLVFIFCSVDGYMITPTPVFVNTFFQKNLCFLFL